MRKAKSSKCMLMLIWVIPVLLIPAALVGSPTMINAAEVTQIKLCVNPSGLTRVPGANERCRPSEKLVQWDVSGSQETTGSQGGALTVIDSTGKTVGPLIRPDAVALTVNGDRLLVGVRPNGFFGTIAACCGQYVVAFYRTGANCSGDRYVEPSTGLFFAHLRLIGGIGYYGGWTSTLTSVASYEYLSTADGSYQCMNSSGSINLTPVKDVKLNTLFTPPLSIK